MKHKVTQSLSVLSCLGVLILSYIQIFETPKMVYVDSNKLLDGYQGMIDAKAIYQNKVSMWKSNIDTLTQEVHNKIIDYERNVAKMSSNEKKLSEELIRVKQKQLKDYQQALNSQAHQEDEKMASEIISQMNSYIKKYGERRGFKIIMAATDYGNIAFADDALDITVEVLEGLNNEYKQTRN